MITWPEALVQAIGRRRCVVVIGSGVSRNSQNVAGRRPASWEDFLKAGASSLGDPAHLVQLIEQKDYLTACEIIKRRKTSHVFLQSIQAEYQQPGYREAQIHQHIYDLDSPIVLSPNFDNIYDTYASSTSAGTLIIKDHTSPDIIQYLAGGDVRLLLKTHGTANTPSNVIFTRRDYAEARTKYVMFYEILKSLVLTQTFLFLGCGVEDPDIRWMFEDVQFAHNAMPYHYMTTPAGEINDEIRVVAAETMKISFLEYSPDSNHIELTSSVEDLAQKVEQFRDQKSVDQKW